MSLTAPDRIAVLDFGGQTAQLIARRLRELGVFSELVRPDISAAELAAPADGRSHGTARGPLRGIVLSGGPASVYEPGAPTCDPAIFDLGLPVLGICYGMQLACRAMGAQVRPAATREFGAAQLTPASSAPTDPLLADLGEPQTVWMSHGDEITDTAGQFVTLASTASCPHAVVRHRHKPVYGVQFHPEVTHTPRGRQWLENFARGLCGCSATWTMGDFAANAVEAIGRQVGDRRVVCGLSGGVDSAVTAALVHRAIGPALTCIFVDNGLLRAGEAQAVRDTFVGHFGIDLRVVDASARFLSALEGIADPQDKRRRIGAAFIEVFEAQAATLGDVGFLAQGTLYPDVIESGVALGGTAKAIKLHHNVGGLPDRMALGLVEPLRWLFKDEVRQLGAVLGLPEELLWRHPFPGPGLAVRIIGPVTAGGLETLRAADTIFLDELRAAGWYRRVSQALAVLLPVSTVGVMGDGRSYESVIALRCVETQDFMTADWSRLPADVLARVAARITNEVRGVNRVVYDISTKPPATIEWE